MWILRFDFEGIQASIFRLASASRNQSASYPARLPVPPARRDARCRRGVLWPLEMRQSSALHHQNHSSGPVQHLALSNKINGRPLPSHTACSFEFKPPLVRPIRLGIDPFLKGSQRFGAPLDASHRSSTGQARPPWRPGLQISC